MVTKLQIDQLYTECQKLPKTSVIEEESHVFGSPLLIAMSTVLSLNRKWYSHALPARKRFENGKYAYLSKEPLANFVNLSIEVVGDTNDWRLLSSTLWENKEWQKAYQLTMLAKYFSDWCGKFHPEDPEKIALQKWAASVQKEQFLGKIKGLGPRAHEQLLWYIEGVNSVKFDRHVRNFLQCSLGADVSESNGISALKNVAERMGISLTSLDARIWDYMQSRANA